MAIRTCRGCHQPFVLEDEDAQRFLTRGLHLPRHCWPCRQFHAQCGRRPPGSIRREWRRVRGTTDDTGALRVLQLWAAVATSMKDDAQHVGPDVGQQEAPGASR